VSRQAATAAGSAEEPKATALLPLVGLPEPLRVHMDFEGEAIDAMIERLVALRRQMEN